MRPIADEQIRKQKLPPGVTQEMIDASLAANPLASTGGYMGDTAVPAAANLAAPAATTQGSPIPGVDPFRLAQANDAYARALASINSRRGSTLTSYGFKASGYDENGTPIGLEVDPTSMYGSYQQMLDEQARSSIAAENEAGSRGFSGGLANQGESALKYGQGAQRLQLGSGLLADMGTLNQSLLAAKKAQGDELYQARLDAARAAADSQNFIQVPSDPYSNPGAATPGTTPELPSVPVTPKQTAAKVAAVARAVAAKTPVSRAQVLAKKVTANKTGATVQRGRGVTTIH